MKIRNVLSIIIMIGSIVLGLWLSLGVLLAGGIQQLVVGCQPGDAGMIAWGIVRALFFEFGFLPFWVGYIAAICLMDS